MATTDASAHGAGTGVGPIGKHRRTTIVAVVVLAFIAIVAPFAVRDLGGSGAEASPTTHASPPPVAPVSHERTAATDPSLGAQGSLPALLPSRSKLTPGARVRLGDVTDGVLRRTPGGAWQVLVRWNGRLQPVPTRGPVQLAAGAASSWIADDGLLYTRVPTGTPGRFRVYTWDPRGGTAYTPPTLVSSSLGQVCFNAGFTAFGNCKTAG